MSNPLIPPLPLPDDDRVPEEEPGTNLPTVERDGERAIDPDADDAQVESVEADRIASGAATDDDDL